MEIHKVGVDFLSPLVCHKYQNAVNHVGLKSGPPRRLSSSHNALTRRVVYVASSPFKELEDRSFGFMVSFLSAN